MTIAISFCLFLIMMVAAGTLASARNEVSAKDYLTAGRSYGKFMVALSGAASATSGFIMIGAVGAGYHLGILAVFMPLSWFLGDFIFWTFFPEKINRAARNNDIATIPEFISISTTGQKNSSTRRFFAVVMIVFVALAAIGQLLAAGKAVTGVFDLSMPVAIGFATFVILLYSARGGLKASIPTQFVQALIMIFTTVGMFSLALYLGGGPNEILLQLGQLNESLLSVTGGRGWWLFAAFVLGFATTAFTFDVGQPQLLVRIMASKSPQEAGKARFTYLAFMQVTWILMSLFGLIMVVLLPDIADAEQALLIFAKANLHPILVGAVLAGVFAAVASTLDALLLLLSSGLGVDLFPGRYARMSAKYGSKYQSVITVLVAIVTSFLAISFVGNGSVFGIIVFSAAGLGVTIGCAMLVSLLNWKTSPGALTSAAIVAVCVTSAWKYFDYSDYFLEAAPGFIAGISTHYMYLKIFKS